MTLHREWVGAEWYDRKNAERNVPALQYFDSAFDLIVRTSTGMIHANTIVQVLRAVHADSDAHAMCAAGLSPGVIEQCAIRLHVERECTDAIEHSMGFAAPGIKLPDADQARLPAVKHNIGMALAGDTTMSVDSIQGRRENLV
jgi:hypothetical protein